jgi:hypothetical protein
MNGPDPNKAQVLWNKGQNFFSAFFAELGNVRREISDDGAFARWCLDDLHIPISVINQVAEVLSRVDAAKAKAELASTRMAEQERLRKEREDRQTMAAAERKRKDEERAAAAAEKARDKELEKQQQKAKERQEKRQARDRRYREQVKEAQRVAYQALGESNKGIETYPQVGIGENILNFPDAGDAREIKEAWRQFVNARGEAKEKLIKAATLLHVARRRFGENDQAFGKWLDRNEITIDKTDRAALIELGSSQEAMRLTLQQTDSISPRAIWRDVQRRLIGNEAIASIT